MDDGHLPAAVFQGVIEGVANDALAPPAGHDRHRLPHGSRIVANGDEMLDPDVQPLEILADQHDIHVLEAATRHDGACRPDVREQLELFPEPDIHRAKPGADGCREGTLQGERVLPDALDGGVRQRSTRGFDRGHTGQLLVPVEAQPGRLEHPDRLGGDLRPYAVTRYQRDIVRHGPGDTGSTAATAAFSA